MDMTTTMKTTKKFVTDGALYFTDNGRVVCGKHCGQTATYTGRDISGQKIERVTTAVGWTWQKNIGEPIQCEVCHLTLDGIIAPAVAADDGEDVEHVCVKCGATVATADHPADGFVCAACSPTTPCTTPLAGIERRVSEQPKLTADQRAVHDRMEKRLARAEREDRKNSSPKTVAKVAKVRAEIAAFVAPFVAHYPPPPPPLLYTTRSPWGRRNANGTHIGTYGVDHGVHDIMVEMVLERLDLSGPQYRTVRCVSDTGGPLTNPRSPATSMGVAWFAVADQIRRGAMVPFTGDDTADRAYVASVLDAPKPATEILTLKVDVTGLTADQLAALTCELVVQCEASDDHPAVTVSHTITRN